MQSLSLYTGVYAKGYYFKNFISFLCSELNRGFNNELLGMNIWENIFMPKGFQTIDMAEGKLNMNAIQSVCICMLL